MRKQVVIVRFDHDDQMLLADLEGWAIVEDSYLTDGYDAYMMFERVLKWWQIFSWSGIRGKDMREITAPTNEQVNTLIDCITEECPILASMTFEKC